MWSCMIRGHRKAPKSTPTQPKMVRKLRYLIFTVLHLTQSVNLAMIFDNDEDDCRPQSPQLVAVQPDLAMDDGPAWRDWSHWRYDWTRGYMKGILTGGWHPGIDIYPDHDYHEDQPDDDLNPYYKLEEGEIREPSEIQDAMLLRSMEPNLSWDEAKNLARRDDSDERPFTIISSDLDWPDLDWHDLDWQETYQLAEPFFLPRKELPPRRKRRNRTILPIKVHAASRNAVIETCPDSGSDENIMSQATANQLQLEIEKPKMEPRKFSLANGKIVEALGQVPVRLSFVAGSSTAAFYDCVFQVFASLAVPAIVGMEFLQATETLSRHTDRLRKQEAAVMQSLRVNSIGTPKRSVVCRLGLNIGFATADTGSDLDLVSPEFASLGGFVVGPGAEQLEFADGSVGWTSGMLRSSLAIGNVDDVEGFLPRGRPTHRDLHVLENLNADIILGEDTLEELDVFKRHAGSFIPSISALGANEVNIIRHVGAVERVASKTWNRLKRKLGREEEVGGEVGGEVGEEGRSKKQCSGDAGNMLIEAQRENSRRESARDAITTLSGFEKSKAQKDEDDRIEKWEEEQRLRAGRRSHT